MGGGSPERVEASCYAPIIHAAPSPSPLHPLHHPYTLSVIPAPPLSVIPAQAGTTRRWTQSLPIAGVRRRRGSLFGRPSGCGWRLGWRVPAYAGMTERGGAGMTEGEWRGRSGWWRAAGGRAGPPTPHLTSPLEGGRDELGEARIGEGRIGGCGRRLGWRVPTCAGMTEKGCRNDGGGMAEGEWRRGNGGGGMAEGERHGRSGCWRAAGGHAGHPTPHLTSPLEGGRDELGEARIGG